MRPEIEARATLTRAIMKAISSKALTLDDIKLLLKVRVELAAHKEDHPPNRPPT